LGEVKSADQSCSCRLNNRPNRAILAADFFDSIDPSETSSLAAGCDAATPVMRIKN